MQQSPSQRLEELIRERARLDIELERLRELVTVLFVDIVGSTRFYDEHGDVAGLVMVQKCLDLLIPVIEQHGGVVIKTIGDAILARFSDAEAAVRSAIEMQRNLDDRNRGRAPDDRIQVRVAINVGMALLKGADVFGDVVNVAARIESAVEPNEIAISPSVYEKIRHLTDLPVRRKASGVELRGKVGKLDLYDVVWRQNESAGPPAQPVKAAAIHRDGSAPARDSSASRKRTRVWNHCRETTRPGQNCGSWHACGGLARGRSAIRDCPSPRGRKCGAALLAGSPWRDRRAERRNCPGG